MANQTTFIPKTPVGGRISKRSGWGWLSALALSVFVLSLLISFGLFFYRGFLEGRVTDLRAELEKVESEFEPSLILELQNTSKAISATRGLLSNHVATSRIFDFLEANTIENVRFLDFSYSNGAVSMSGIAGTYTAMAQQSLVFEQSRLIDDVSFSNFSLTSGGLVNFSVNFVPVDELISYSAAQTAGQTPPN